MPKRIDQAISKAIKYLESEGISIPPELLPVDDTAKKAELLSLAETIMARQNKLSDGTKALEYGLVEHIQDHSNPHEVTPAQIGAERTGSALGVLDLLGKHQENYKNPHKVTPGQIGSPKLVIPATPDNIVVFSSLSGSQKDSGVSIVDLAPAAHEHEHTHPLQIPVIASMGGMGDVSNDGSVVDGNFPMYEGTSGKVIMDSGYAAIDFEPAQTKGNLTATAPIVFDVTRQVIGGAAMVSIPKATTLVDGYLAAADWTIFNAKQAALTFPLAATLGGTGVNNAGTLTNATATTITGGGTLALGGFTLTVPATGTAALLATANVFTAVNQFGDGVLITGGADKIQLRILDNATQTTNPFELQKSTAAVQISFDDNGGAIFNEAGNAAGDFRVESDTEANMIFLDASANAVGIKQAAPTAYLHIGAGSATAGTAPLKMTSGALLATPEAGSIEFYDGRFFLTGTGKQRAIDRTSSNVNVANVVVAATAAETTLYLWSLSANAMKVGRIYKVNLDGILSAAANKTITFNFYFGTGLYVTSTTTPGNILNKPWHVEYTVTIRTTGNGGTSSLHRHLNINGVDSGVSSLQAIDTTAANDVTLKVQWSDNNAGNSITLYQAYLELKN